LARPLNGFERRLLACGTALLLIYAMRNNGIQH